MSVLRFPNPGSDIAKFISTYVAIYKELQDTPNFTHDNARDAMIKNGLVSSSGAIGDEAVKRSYRDDRSLDSLYNQHKMYSELYRMLGWYKPGTMNTNFNFTELASYIAAADPSLQKRIFEECLLSIVFPNPLVDNKKGNVLRPFPVILSLASSLNGVIFRDEIIVSVLTIQNDRNGNALQQALNLVNKIRTSKKALLLAKSDLSNATGIAEETLENYTRFPLGALKYTGWFDSGSIRDVYDKPIQGYTLTVTGNEKMNRQRILKDIRHEDIEQFDLNARGAFTLLSSYIFLERCGYDISGIDNVLHDVTTKCSDILAHLAIAEPSSIFYSPFQQALQEEIDFANDLDQSYQQ